MVQLGPDYDVAVRLRELEQRVAQMEANGLGQAFSSTQSDGSIGAYIRQNTAGSGATALVFLQGPTSTRDPSTGQHPTLLYLGELFSGGVAVDSGALWSRPDGTQMAVLGNRGVQILDPAGNQVLASDEYGATPGRKGLTSPWIAYGQPVTNNVNNTGWPNTTGSGPVALLTFPAQHPNITWYGNTYCPAGSGGTVQVTVNNGAAGASWPVGAGFTPLNETFGLGTWSWHEVLTLAVQAELTVGAGPIYVQVYGVWGCGS